jgi:hypothetical protein
LVTSTGQHLIDDIGVGGDERDIELALDALADDVEMQQAHEAQAEAEAQRLGGLTLEVERRIRQVELLDGGLEAGVISGIDRVEAGEHHRVYFLIARQGAVYRRWYRPS